jgi:hypothetical protein
MKSGDVNSFIFTLAENNRLQMGVFEVCARAHVNIKAIRSTKNNFTFMKIAIYNPIQWGYN